MLIRECCGVNRQYKDKQLMYELFKSTGKNKEYVRNNLVSALFIVKVHLDAS